jgi:hypothetical protein
MIEGDEVADLLLVYLRSRRSRTSAAGLGLLRAGDLFDFST